MGELFSYLNVAETAAAAAVEETKSGGGGEDELLHGGNIIEGARGATAAEASSSSLARAPGRVSHYPFAFPRYANDDGLLPSYVHEHECL